MRWIRLAGVASIGLCACAAIWGFDDLKPGGPGPDGGSDAMMDAGPTCPLAKPPAPPAAGDMAGIDFMSAISFLDVGIPKADAGSVPAFDKFYDLDDPCTYCTP